VKFNFLRGGKTIYLVFTFLLFSFSFFLITALDVADDTNEVTGVNIQVPEETQNFSLLMVNASEWWITTEGNLDNVADIDHNDLNNLEWSNAGHTIDTDLDLGGNNIFNVNQINASFFNWTATSLDNWINLTFTGSHLTTKFNETKFDPTYHNPTQSNVITGTIDGGTLADVQHPDAKYDGVTFNFSEEVGGLDLRINFTGLDVDTFKRGIMRYKTSNLKGDFPLVQMWSYGDNEWEDYPHLIESDTFAIMTQPVFDGADHIQDGVAQMRIYKPASGNTNNHYYVDWIAIVSGVGLPIGEEVDPVFNSWLLNPVFENNVNGSGYNMTIDYLNTTYDSGIGKDLFVGRDFYCVDDSVVQGDSDVYGDIVANADRTTQQGLLLKGSGSTASQRGGFISLYRNDGEGADTYVADIFANSVGMIVFANRNQNTGNDLGTSCWFATATGQFSCAGGDFDVNADGDITDVSDITSDGDIETTGGRFASNTKTITASSDTISVADVNIVFINPAGAVVVGAFIGGIAGQVLHVVAVNNDQNIALEHNEGTGNQNIFLNSGADETLSSSFGGWTLVCDGSNWYEVDN